MEAEERTRILEDPAHAENAAYFSDDPEEQTMVGNILRQESDDISLPDREPDYFDFQDDETDFQDDAFRRDDGGDEEEAIPKRSR